MIDTNEAMTQFLPQLKAADWVALDTEADSLHAYPEKVCLIQVSVTEADRMVDPLAGIDLEPFWPALKRHELIMHGADYDLRLLRKRYGFVPDKIFDTMLASRLLGDREFGLFNLVSKYLGVSLDKGPQKADWARRPLTPRMETYARNDTHYLKPLSDILKARLKEKNRLTWQQESCDRLIAECSIPTVPEPDLVWRIKGSHRLNRAALAVLRELWNWREQEAISANKPPYFVLSHESLVEIAAAAAEHRSYEAHVPRHFSTRRSEGLAKAIAAGMTVAPDNFPTLRRLVSRRQTEPERKRFEQLQKKRNHQANELGIDPTLIASRATMLLLAQDWAKHEPELMSWQRELLAQ